MAYPPSSYKTWTVGEVLTAGDLNSTVTTINNAFIPADIDDYSVTTTEMRTTADPYPAGVESAATGLDGEIARLRYVLAQITGETYWYVDPDTSIAAIVTSLATKVGTTGDETIAGAKTFSGITAFADGSQSAPSMAHSGDLNTGRYYPAADTIADVTAGEIAHQINPDGSNRFPLQPRFMVRLGSLQSNVTGNGTVYTIPFDTEDLDASSDFNPATGIFTASVTGSYLFNGVASAQGLTSATWVECRLVTTAQTYYGGQVIASNLGSSARVTFGGIVQMTAGDTARFQIMVAGELGDTADVNTECNFSGMLVA